MAKKDTMWDVPMAPLYLSIMFSILGGLQLIFGILPAEIFVGDMTILTDNFAETLLGFGFGFAVTWCIFVWLDTKMTRKMRDEPK